MAAGGVKVRRVACRWGVMDARATAGRRAVAALAVTLLTGASVGCGSGSSSPAKSQPQQTQDTVAPPGGLPGAVDRAGQVKDQSNQHSRELERQVDTYAK